MSLPASPSHRRTRLALLVAAFAVHGLLAWLEWRPSPRLLVGDELRYLERARQIAAGETPPPDLLWPPLYPYFLAPFARLGAAERAATVLAQLALLAGSALLVRDLARRWAGPGLHTDLAAFLLFASPPFAAYAYYLWPEVLHLSLFLSCVWILAARREAWRWLVALGLLLGLALQTKSLLTGFIPVLMAPLLAERPVKRGLGRVAVVLGVCLATVLPAVVSHGLQAGSWVIADSTRFNLWLGLTDPAREEVADRRIAQAHRDFQASGAGLEERNQAFELRIRRHLEQQGGLGTLSGQLGKQPFRLLSRDSDLTDQLPGGRLAQRGRGYTSSSSALTAALRRASWGLHALVLALAPLGLALFPPRGRAWCWMLLGFLAYNALLFLGLHATPRYLFQMLPMLVLGAAFSASTLLTDLSKFREVPLPRLGAGLAFGAVLAWAGLVGP